MSKPATKAECEHMDRVAAFGCVACFVQFGTWGTPAEFHHVRKYTERRNHLKGYGLCEPGHHRNSTKEKYSRHGDPAYFIETYGTDEQLLEIVTEKLNQREKS